MDDCAADSLAAIIVEAADHNNKQGTGIHNKIDDFPTATA